MPKRKDDEASYIFFATIEAFMHRKGAYDKKRKESENKNNHEHHPFLPLPVHRVFTVEKQVTEKGGFQNFSSPL